MDDDDVNPYMSYRRTDGMTLEDYIGSLLRMGKRSKDPEFQNLFNAFGAKGRQKIIDIAKRILEKERLNEVK